MTGVDLYITMCYSVLESETNRDWKILITSYSMNTHAHNHMELPELSKNNEKTGNLHTKSPSSQNSTHTYMQREQ